MRRRRTSIEKQEKLVSALWELVRKNQNIPIGTCVISDSKGTKMADGACRNAIWEIMAIFGYDVVEVQ